jgi:hypothetical protein
MQDNDRKTQDDDSDFWPALRKGLLLGAAILVIVVPPLRMRKAPQPPAQPPVAQAPATTPAPDAAATPDIAQAPDTSIAGNAAGQQAPVARNGVRLADFGGEDPSPQARHLANWAVFTRDHRKNAFVIVDKADARVYVFGPDGKLKESAPALLGSAHGDHSVPGIGEKPLKLIKPDEKTTPAGRFVAEPGKNANGEDIIWVDYEAAVSMHRIRPLVAAERRLERLATLTVDDNRISFGCINLPVTFYETVLSPTVHKYGAIVYVLPETKTPQQLFGSYDVPASQASLKPQKRT